MFQRTTIITFLLLTLVTGLSVFSVLKRSKTAPFPHEWKAPKQATLYPTKQMRSGVQKDLWIANDGFRLHHRMISPRSILTAYPKGENFEIIEEMQGMKCYLQEHIEKGENPTQQIRFIESASGTYRYSDQHFEAHQVFLALFRMPGDTLETTLDFNDAFLKGVAQEVSLSFSEKSPDFHAEKFKAHIRPKQHE